MINIGFSVRHYLAKCEYNSLEAVNCGIQVKHRANHSRKTTHETITSLPMMHRLLDKRQHSFTLFCIINNEDFRMKLNEIARINAGHPFRGRIQEKPGTGVFAVQMKNISTNQSVDWISCTETTLAGKREPDWLTPGDVLFAARGNNNYAVLIDESMASIRAVAAPHFFVLRRKTRQLLPGFLAWLLNRPPSQHYFRREAEGTLTKSIRRSVLAATPVVLPPLDKQQTIIHLANTLNKKQQLMEQLIHNGETLMNGIANDLLKTPGANAQ